MRDTVPRYSVEMPFSAVLVSLLRKGMNDGDKGRMSSTRTDEHKRGNANFATGPGKWCGGRLAIWPRPGLTTRKQNPMRPKRDAGDAFGTMGNEAGEMKCDKLSVTEAAERNTSRRAKYGVEVAVDAVAAPHPTSRIG
jgi:hypothetical protein